MSAHEQQVREFVLRTGASTRVVTLRTGERVAYAREALDGMLRQVGSRFVPLAVEHLTYLPPSGRIHGGEIVEDDDGHAELYLHARELTADRAADLTLPPVAFRDAEPFDQQLGDVEVLATARNFSPADWRAIEADAPIPLREAEAQSLLPPIHWLIVVPVVWGITQFAGGFLQRMGQDVAERLVGWIARSAARARDAERENLVQVRFETAGGVAISGFLPLDIGSSAATEELRAGLENLGPVAEFAGAVAAEGGQELQLAAFFYSDGQWVLGWWASPDRVFVSRWFDRNYPDPSRFLGRPLLEHPEGSGPSGEDGPAD
jgi:hypothetical protein